MNSIKEAVTVGQSIWLDNLSRTLLQEGTLARWIAEDGVSGVTSNPSIFHKAVSESPYYTDDLARLKAAESDPERRYEGLAIPDIRAACDLMGPVFEGSAGDDGYVSLEVAPRWAHDQQATVAEARRLSALVDRPNLLVKVPATPAGIEAFETLTAEGINVNVTLLFSLGQVEAIHQAYLRGLRARLARGEDVSRAKAVASLFLSRVDTLVDRRLEEIGTPDALSLRGRNAVAMARLAYDRYRALFHGREFADLKARGARPQYLLWASTGTKNPAYSDLLYVEPLVGAETINTLPDKTLAAMREHGRVRDSVGLGLDEARVHYGRLADLGIDMEQVGLQLQDQGVDLFAESFDKLLALMA
jgi:transaldolase